ncbi:MAG: ATPase [Oscillospiraceae bacterium]|nr:ATPase [Oscillospiraceae bacterium]
MSIEKLELVSIAGTLPHLNDAIVACLQSGVFHIENAAKLLGSAEEAGTGRTELNPYAEPLRALSELDLRQIHIDPAAEPAPGEFTPEQIMQETARITDSMRTVRDGIVAAEKKIADYENSAIHLKHLKQADIDLGELVKCRHIVYRFGRMPEENMLKLDFYSDEGFIFQTYHTAHEYVWGFYFATQERIASVDAIMKGLLFERYELPEDISGTPEQALAGLQSRLTEKKTELAELQKQEKQIYDTEAELLRNMYRHARYQSEVYRLRSNCVIMKDKFNLMGYIPASEHDRFKKRIDWVPEVTATYEAPWADSKVQPPVRLKNGWFSKPFSMFVEMYGLPNYNGYNPTTFVAITYTLLFGIMFGDLGQGLVLAAIGMFLSIKKGITLGGVMTRIGISSAFFGTLYGSVFGYEEMLDPLWEKTGIPYLPLKAMENMNVFVYGAIGLGAVIIIVSMLINIAVNLRRRNFTEAVFGNNGVAGLVFFASVMTLIVGLVTGKQLLPKTVAFAILGATLLLMFFREPLGHWLAHKHYESEGLADFIAGNFFECFEFLLGYTSNTISFIRVGGFVFSHAGLMAVVMTIADMIGGDHKSIITVIIGNIIVMGFEGLIVGIQVMRLEFYEIFSRCYDGDGKPFTPISVSFDDLSENKQSEQTANA